MKATRIRAGTLVTSKIHTPEARGPYVVLYHLNSGFLVCVSLDGNHSVNLPEDQVGYCIIADEVYKLIKQKMEDY